MSENCFDVDLTAPLDDNLLDFLGGPSKSIQSQQPPPPQSQQHVVQQQQHQINILPNNNNNIQHLQQLTLSNSISFTKEGLNLCQMLIIHYNIRQRL